MMLKAELLSPRTSRTDGKFNFFKAKKSSLTFKIHLSIDETDWSMQMAEEIFNAEFDCPGCSQIFNFTNIQKLQHMAVCKKPVEEIIVDDSLRPASSSSNQKLYKCLVCLKQMHMSNIEILKHKKSCKIKVEKE